MIERDDLVVLMDESHHYRADRGPAARQFELVCNGSHQYEPDFVVETESDIYLVEIKRHDQVEDDDVKAKRERAVTYCQKATTWAKANGYKPWTHLFIPDNEVRSERLLADYVKMFVVGERKEC